MGKIDFSQVGLMGHSRGGEGVFLHGIEALRSLDEAVDDPAGTLSQAVLYTYMERIRRVARSLASLAIAEAGEGAPAIQAELLVYEGDIRLLLYKDFAAAVEEYLSAWRLVAAALAVEAGPDQQSAQGAVGWGEMIDVDGDGTPDAPFYGVMAEAEAIVANLDATHADLVRAKDLAEAANLLDVADPACASVGGAGEDT